MDLVNLADLRGFSKFIGFRGWVRQKRLQVQISFMITFTTLPSMFVPIVDRAAGSTLPYYMPCDNISRLLNVALLSKKLVASRYFEYELGATVSSLILEAPRGVS